MTPNIEVKHNDSNHEVTVKLFFDADPDASPSEDGSVELSAAMFTMTDDEAMELADKLLAAVGVER